MIALLLTVIYLAFISLGLPDSLLGSAWPVIHLQFGVDSALAGLVSLVITLGTVVSALLSDRLTRRLGAGLVTALSVAMTAAALLGFSFSRSVAALCLWAVPYGLGAGAVDAALNNYVALHFKARHMSWLHCFWGLGASLSPLIMGFYLSRGENWQGGYRCVSLIQWGLTAALFLSLPLWRKLQSPQEEAARSAPPLGLRRALAIPGVPYMLTAFFCYCGLETVTFLWTSSYLVSVRGLSPDRAAFFGSFMYAGMTVGRLLNGFVAEGMGDRRMIRVGAGVMLLAVALLLQPWTPLALAGLLVLGLGAGPVYPSIIHATPANFGAENSQAIIGVQMASAYLGSSLLPPLFGAVATRTTLALFPYALALLVLALLAMTEKLNRLRRESSRQEAQA